MPVYDFKCSKCNKELEDQIVPSATNTDRWPVCCEQTMEKQFHPSTRIGYWNQNPNRGFKYGE